ncbi:hypothetical protein Poly30_19070 [Planctomycetes bacterium Poly30]|uniref:Uncharacterized protein n=1 Tax=Saltatorellus ferox TaxID=2528018 RepID=A0A518EQN6_9BACT|nr:hypothetical protein Poly30_19070 [Planctomycetes bacterium Poly30]
MSFPSLRGHLLLSAPSMQDPNFMHTVVLICQHDENGAFGMTVNRTSRAMIKDVFPESPVLGGLDLPIRSGGPVSPNSLQILHRLPPGIGVGELELESVEDELSAAMLEAEAGHGAGSGSDSDWGSPLASMRAGVEVAPGVRLGADLDQVAEFLAGQPDGDSFARFVVGYSGWGEGQLDAEMRMGSWLPVPATADLVFAEGTGESVWRAALARVPGGGESLAHLPPDPSWN